MLLLFPADPLAPSRADDHVASEAEAASDAAIAVALIDHDALVRGHIDEAVRRVHSTSDDAVYRGWMVTSTQYAQLAAALADRGVRLRTSPEAYGRAHELPGWHAALGAHTPRSIWVEGSDIDALTGVARRLPPGAGVLKDFVKSLKHRWDDAMFVPDVHDAASIRRIAEAFLDERSDDLAGGLVVRAYERWQPGEARTWWIDGRCALVTAHPDAPDVHLEVPSSVLEELAPTVASLGCPFVAVDLARAVDGPFRVVEVGDGQVSDRPRSIDPGSIVRALRR